MPFRKPPRNKLLSGNPVDGLYRKHIPGINDPSSIDSAFEHIINSNSAKPEPASGDHDTDVQITAKTLLISLLNIINGHS